MDNYSLSDLAAATNGGGFGGGSSAWVLIILFALIFGWGGFGGNRNGDFSNFATAASQSEILIGQQFQGVNQAINKIGDGLSSLGYSQLQQMDNNTASINGNVVNEGRAIQTQLANCCCENQRNVDSVRFDMSNYAAQINANIDNKFAALEKAGLEQRIADQAAQINQLQLNAQLAGIVRYPMASTYTSGSNPFCACNCCGNI